MDFSSRSSSKWRVVCHFDRREKSSEWKVDFSSRSSSKWQEGVISTWGRNLVNVKWISRREAHRNDDGCVISTVGRNLVNVKWISRREAPRNDKRESFRPWAERMGRNPVNVKWISRSLHSFGMMERWISQSLHSFEMTRMWISRLLHSLEMAWKMTYFYKKMIFYEKFFWKMKKISDFWSKMERNYPYFDIKTENVQWKLS